MPAGASARPLPIRIAIGDDSYLIREAITALLEAAEGFEVVAVCADGDQLLDAVDRLRPTVVVTDMRMPPSGDEEGLRIARRLRADHPEVGVLVLTQHEDPRYGRALVEDGAEGRAYMLKDRVHDRRELASAIELVARGESVIDPRIVSGLLAPARDGRTVAALSSLTPRERDVLTLMAQGKSNAAIAGELVLTRHAVEKYVGAIFGKLGIDDEQDVSRRVVAVLRYLEASGS